MASTAAQSQILAAHHTSITVRSLDRGTHIFRDLFGLPLARGGTLESPISTITGHPEASFDFAYFELPGGHGIEMMQYSKPASAETEAVRPQPWQGGCWSLCLVVASLDTIVKTLESAMWEGESMGWKILAEPQTMSVPGADMRMCFVRDSEGINLHLMEMVAA